MGLSTNSPKTGLCLQQLKKRSLSRTRNVTKLFKLWGSTSLTVMTYQKHVQDPPKKMCHQSTCERNNVSSSHHWAERMSISNDVYLRAHESWCLDLLTLDSISTCHFWVLRVLILGYIYAISMMRSYEWRCIWVWANEIFIIFLKKSTIYYTVLNHSPW